MTSPPSRTELVRLLGRLGVTDARLIVVISDLAALGTFDARDVEGGALRGLVDGFLEATGGDGTLVVPTFTYTRQGAESPYVHETTPSETGALTDHIRRMPGSVRSIHPVFSFTALGKARDAICANASRHSYGWNSPTHRLVEDDALVISLGRSPHRGSFFIHLAETFVGVPYRYTKELAIPVMVGGRPVEQSFYHFVKYADADLVWDTNRLVDRLESRGMLRYEPWGASGVWAYRGRHMFEETVALLARNIYGLLAHPPTRTPWRA
jgi:aminoglycoside 3-N-acetyltransferase